MRSEIPIPATDPLEKYGLARRRVEIVAEALFDEVHEAHVVAYTRQVDSSSIVFGAKGPDIPGPVSTSVAFVGIGRTST